MTRAMTASDGAAKASGSHCLRFTAIVSPRTRPSSSADGQGRGDVAETLRERQEVVKRRPRSVPLSLVDDGEQRLARPQPAQVLHERVDGATGPPGRAAAGVGRDDGPR